MMVELLLTCRENHTFCILVREDDKKWHSVRCPVCLSSPISYRLNRVSQAPIPSICPEPIANFKRKQLDHEDRHAI